MKGTREIAFPAYRHVFRRGARGRYHSTRRGEGGTLVHVLFYEKEGFFSSWGAAEDRTDTESVSVVKRNGELLLFGVDIGGGEREVTLLCPPTFRIRGTPLHIWEVGGHWERDILHGERQVPTKEVGRHPEGRGRRVLTYDGENPVTLTIPVLKGGKNVPPEADQVTLLWEVW
jgi:hypothetical protein